VDRGIPPRGATQWRNKKNPAINKKAVRRKTARPTRARGEHNCEEGGGHCEKRGTRFCSHALLCCLTRQVNQSTHTHAPGSSNLENKRSTTINAHVIFFHLRQNGTYAKVHCSSVHFWTLLSPPYRAPPIYPLTPLTR
jgi:hypothetical protein